MFTQLLFEQEGAIGGVNAHESASESDTSESSSEESVEFDSGTLVFECTGLWCIHIA